MDTATGTPFCSHCNYDLTGLTDSPRCPECGRPLVEVLQRRGYGVGGARRGKRYRSTATIFGLPVIDIALGPDANEQVGRAKGFIAIGDIATGFLSIGAISCGIVSFGGISVGLFSLGGLAVSLLASMGGLAISSGLALGGCAIGTIATGGGAIGYIAQGGGAIGTFIRDGNSMNRRRPDPAVFHTLRWLLGNGANATILLLPLFWALASTTFSAAFLGLVARLRLNRHKTK